MHKFYVGSLEIVELKEEDISTRLLEPLQKQQKTQQLILLNWQVLLKILRLKTF